jgi:hypothetical protein
MKVSTILAALMLAGCASDPNHVEKPKPPPVAKEPSDGWIKGTMTRLEDGATFSFRIQKKWAFGGSATGGVAAIGESETYRGQYTGILPGGSANTWGQSTATAYGSGGWATANASGSSHTQWQSRTANAQASMTDSNGTAIHVQMTIQAGFSPHGLGQGIDNQGRHYQITF